MVFYYLGVIFIFSIAEAEWLICLKLARKLGSSPGPAFVLSLYFPIIALVFVFLNPILGSSAILIGSRLSSPTGSLAAAHFLINVGILISIMPTLGLVGLLTINQPSRYKYPILIGSFLIIIILILFGGILNFILWSWSP